jgi:hypothetical protein
MAWANGGMAPLFFTSPLDGANISHSQLQKKSRTADSFSTTTCTIDDGQLGRNMLWFAIRGGGEGEGEEEEVWILTEVVERRWKWNAKSDYRQLLSLFSVVKERNWEIPWSTRGFILREETNSLRITVSLILLLVKVPVFNLSFSFGIWKFEFYRPPDHR